MNPDVPTHVNCRCNPKLMMVSTPGYADDLWERFNKAMNSKAMVNGVVLPAEYTLAYRSPAYSRRIALIFQIKNLKSNRN